MSFLYKVDFLVKGVIRSISCHTSVLCDLWTQHHSFMRVSTLYKVSFPIPLFRCHSTWHRFCGKLLDTTQHDTSLSRDPAVAHFADMAGNQEIMIIIIISAGNTRCYAGRVLHVVSIDYVALLSHCVMTMVPSSCKATIVDVSNRRHLALCWHRTWCWMIQ